MSELAAKSRPAVRAVKTTISLPPDAVATLRELATARNTTLAEVVRRAISVEKFLGEALQTGCKILVEKKGKTKELIIF
jgi:hypothetical protein